MKINVFKRVGRMVKYLLPLYLFTLLPLSLRAQEITSVHGTVSDELGGLMGATVCEIDANGRIINSAVTDLNGNFTMKVKNTKDKIRFTYVGMAAQVLPINKTTFNKNRLLKQLGRKWQKYL